MSESVEQSVALQMPKMSDISTEKREGSKYLLRHRVQERYNLCR